MWDTGGVCRIGSGATQRDVGCVYQSIRVGAKYRAGTCFRGVYVTVSGVKYGQEGELLSPIVRDSVSSHMPSPLELAVSTLLKKKTYLPTVTSIRAQWGTRVPERTGLGNLRGNYHVKRDRNAGVTGNSRRGRLCSYAYTPTS